MTKIVCGTFHNKVMELNLSSETKEYNLISRKLSKKTIFDNCSFLGVDKTRYYYNGENSPLRLFSASTLNCKKIFVLTSRECHYLRVACGITNVKILVLEKELPFIEGIKFVNDAKKNYKFLKSILHKCKSLYGLPNGYYSTLFFNKIAKKIRKTSFLDLVFAFTQKGGYQEVFALKELRDDRKILAYDFNSMYPSCLTKALYPDPSKLVYKEFNCIYDQSLGLGYGVFHVILKNPTSDFIKRYHNIKYLYLTKRYDFNLEDEDCVETLLQTCEIEFYSKHFSEIKIIDGVFSEVGIRHPLAQTVKALYKKRLTAGKNNKELESFYKKLLTIACSSSGHIKSTSSEFNTGDLKIESLFQWIEINLGISQPECMPNSIYLHKLVANGKITLKKTSNDKFLFSIPLDLPEKSQVNIDHVYVFSSYMFALARVKMLELLEFISKFSLCKAEICYVNVDSVHVSVEAKFSENMKKYLIEADFADIGKTKELGKLKLEHEADKAIWMGQGRYWLIKDGVLFKYVNAMMNIKRINECCAVKKSFDIRKVIDDDFSYLTTKKIYIDNYLEFSRKLEDITDEKFVKFNRYDYLNIRNYDSIKESKGKEKERSFVIQKETYLSIAKLKKLNK